MNQKKNFRWSLKIKYSGLASVFLLAAILASSSAFAGSNVTEQITNNRNEPIPLQVGVGVGDITPPVGFIASRGVGTGVGSPLYAKALVFKQGDKKAALVICDLIRVTRDLSRLVREKVAKLTDIPFENISICATHTHTGPEYMLQMQEFADREAKGKLTSEDQTGYLSQLINNVANSIIIANNNVQEIKLFSGIGHAEGISFNRRFLMTNGHVNINPGNLNPRIVKAAGPNDPNVHFLSFKSIQQNKYLASLTVFANHLDTYGGTEFHADYPYYLQEHLKKIFGEQLVSVFGTGTCANINHFDLSRSKEATQKGREISEKIGSKLAEAIKDNNSSFEEQDIPSLEVISKTIYLPLQDFSKEEYEWATNENAKPLYKARLARARKIKIRSLDRMQQHEAIQPAVFGEPWMYPAELHIIRLSKNAVIVTMPGEIFVELGLLLKKHSPFSNTLVIELANSNMYYVPTAQAYKEGDYEVVNSRLTPGSGEKMVEEILSVLREIKL